MVRACARHSVARALLTPLFPHFRSHRPQPPAREIAGWLHRGVRQRLTRRERGRRIAAALDDPRPMFLLPLQLDSDAQIRFHSPFAGMGEVIDKVIGCFARAAPRTARLVIKGHPLDNGVVDYARISAAVAAAHGVAARVSFIDGGHLPTLLRTARGVVTVNSTVGLQALHHGCATKVLGQAIYDRPRLTDAKPLPGFWWSPQPPEAEAYRRFRRFLLATSQFNGSFYTDEGRSRLLPAILRRLAEPAAGAAAPLAVPQPCAEPERIEPPRARPAILPLPA
jgi:capsular polysaccharide export protein